MPIDTTRFRAYLIASGMPEDAASHLTDCAAAVQDALEGAHVRMCEEFDIGSAQFIELVRGSLDSLERTGRMRGEELPHYSQEHVRTFMTSLQESGLDETEAREVVEQSDFIQAEMMALAMNFQQRFPDSSFERFKLQLKAAIKGLDGAVRRLRKARR